VIDHISPLACGGAHAPSNMQWQTIEAAKAKGKIVTSARFYPSHRLLSVSAIPTWSDGGTLRKIECRCTRSSFKATAAAV
jgi:hypothetical protein